MAPFFIGGRMEDSKRKRALQRLNELATHLDATLTTLKEIHRESVADELGFPSTITMLRWEKRLDLKIDAIKRLAI